jgi:DNA-binding CsgD family transcriptional regulator
VRPATDSDLLGRAEQLCTPKQLEALRLVALGYGTRRIARVLNISPQAVTARLDGARRRLQA